MRSRQVLTVILILGHLLQIGCGGKVQTKIEAFNSTSARIDRIANLYVPTAIDGIPIVAAELKWNQQTIDKVRTALQKIQTSARSVSKALGQIADSAITPDQKLLVGPLLRIIVDTLAELNNAGLFNISDQVESTVRLAIFGLQTTIRLLPSYQAQ